MGGYTVKVLGIDTSTKTMSIAISEEDKILGEVNFYSNMDHSEKIMGNLTFLLESCDLNLSDIDVFAVAEGPGSFTGIRISIATIKGLIEFSEKEVVPVSSLDILAANVKRGTVAVAIDAKRNRVYGLIKNIDTGESILKGDLYNTNEFKSHLREDMVLLSDIFEDFKDVNIKRGRGRELINSAANLCLLATDLYEQNKGGINQSELRANYMTKSSAELQKEGKC